MSRAVSVSAIERCRVGMTPDEIRGLLGEGLQLSLTAISYPAAAGGDYWVAFGSAPGSGGAEAGPTTLALRLTVLVYYPENQGSPTYVLPPGKRGKPFPEPSDIM